MKDLGKLKVAFVHDDLVQWGGAERVLLAISEIFPEAPIYTSVFDQNNQLLAQNFKDQKIITSFIQKIPGWKKLYKPLLPLYPVAFEQFDFSEYDLVISQTTRFAKSIITKPETIHLCYCHTPPRFLWNFSGEKTSKLLQPYLSFLRIYDRVSSTRPDFWLAGSKNCQARLKKIYQVDSKVVLPFVDLKRFANVESLDGDYFLMISRLNSYKKVDVAVEAFNQNGKPLKIIGTGPDFGQLKKIAKSNIEFIGQASEQTLINLLSGCKAVILIAEEDFGITPLEAQACGKPVIAFGQGGVLETVVPGKTGLFFDQQSPESLNQAISEFEKQEFRDHDCRNRAEQFSKENFQKNFLNTLHQSTLKLKV